MHAEYANAMQLEYASRIIVGKMHSGIIMDFDWYQDAAELQVGRGG